MKTLLKLYLCFLMLLVTSPSFAWVAGNGLRITTVTSWEGTDNGGVLYFGTSGGFTCWIQASQKTLYSMILTLYATGKPAEIYCYDAVDEIVGGVPGAHKLHRLQAQE
jgi:hypothetical protein